MAAPAQMKKDSSADTEGSSTFGFHNICTMEVGRVQNSRFYFLDPVRVWDKAGLAPNMSRLRELSMQFMGQVRSVL